MLTINTQVSLLNVPFNSDFSHLLYFANKGQQLDYFNSKVVKTFTDFKYQKYPISNGKNDELVVPINIDKIHNCNYIMYRNNNYTNDYFYAFIEKFEYVNEKATRLYLTPDSWNNWQQALIWSKSFVERSTVSTDYYNCLADAPATGQLIEDKSTRFEFSGVYVAFCSCDVTKDDPSDSKNYECHIGDYHIPCWVVAWLPGEEEIMAKQLQIITSKGWSDRIISLNYIPFIQNLTEKITYENVTNNTDLGALRVIKSINVDALKSYITLDISKANEYKKGLTYPYAKVVIMDETTGQTVELAPEKFSSTSIQFLVESTFSETPYFKVIPMNYEGQAFAYNQSLVVKGDSTLPLANNLYAKYLMMNSESNKLQVAGGIIGGVLGVASGVASGSAIGVAGGLTSAFQSIAGVVAQENQAKKLGNSVTKICDGAMERICFTNAIKISLFTMDTEHLNQANNFWKMYGYPIRKLEYPNFGGNGNYSFIKMTEPHVYGVGVPNDELLTIKNIFERGVTLWQPSKFLEY